MNRRLWLVLVSVVILVTALVIRNQVRVYNNRQARAQVAQTPVAEALPEAPVPEEVVPPVEEIRRALFELLQPVALANCDLQRFGEANDGGYLMCGNLLGEVQAGYSYGISGYDQWGCDVSTKLGVRVHQYDCFDTRQPACPGGDTIFHAECIADSTHVQDGRPFDTFQNQFARNGDAGKRLVLKIDVEGAEWDAFLHAPEAVLAQFDQIAVEFHWTDEHKYLKVLERLTQRFHVAHLHFNNFSCVGHLTPFPGWAYEVLFVNKRIGVVDTAKPAGGRHPQDAPNDPAAPDCQVEPR